MTINSSLNMHYIKKGLPPGWLFWEHQPRAAGLLFQAKLKTVPT